MTPMRSSMDSADAAPRRGWQQSALAALLPAAVVLALAGALFGAAPQRFLPVWNDEVVYWNEAAVFAHAGFDGGYITADERTAPAEFSHFGAHGPFFAVLHGSIGRVVGWAPYSAFLINLAVISLSAFAWFRASAGGSAGSAPLLVATFWPLLLYLPTNMQEPTHFAFAFLFALAIDRPARPGAWTSAWTALLIVVASLLRPSWALMILPLGWVAARRSGPWAVAVLTVVTVAAAAAAWSAFGLLASPFQNSMQQLTQAVIENPTAAPATMVSKAAINLKWWFATSEDQPPEIVFRYFLAIFMAALFLRLVIAWLRKRDATEALEQCALVLAPVVTMVICFGQVESWRDFRLLAPHVLTALLIVAAKARWARWLWGATLLFVPLHYQQFVEFHEERFTSDPAPIAAMHDAAAAAMTFVPGASPWRNTVLVPIELVQFPLLGLPPGIGISYVIDWSDLKSVQSAYVVLSPGDREEAKTLGRLVPLAETPLGTLYRNAGPAR